MVNEVEDDNGEKRPKPFKQRGQIQISDEYVKLLECSHIHAIPATAISAARKLPRKLIAPAKNLIYALSAMSDKKAVMKQTTVIEYAGLAPRRPNEADSAVTNLLENMQKAGIVKLEKHPSKCDERVFGIELVL